jgi:hypothetical protein
MFNVYPFVKPQPFQPAGSIVLKPTFQKWAFKSKMMTAQKTRKIASSVGILLPRTTAPPSFPGLLLLDHGLIVVLLAAMRQSTG